METTTFTASYTVDSTKIIPFTNYLRGQILGVQPITDLNEAITFINQRANQLITNWLAPFATQQLEQDSKTALQAQKQSVVDAIGQSVTITVQ